MTTLKAPMKVKHWQKKKRQKYMTHLRQNRRVWSNN